MVTIPLHKALQIFEENLDEIRDAISENLLVEYAERKKEFFLRQKLCKNEELFIYLCDEVLKKTFEEQTRLLSTVQRRINSNKNKRSDRVIDEDIEKAKEVPLLPLVQELVSLRKVGRRRYVGCCPFHKEKTASFYVFEDKNNFHCFGCGEHGDVISFVMKTQNKNFIETIKMLRV